MQCIIEAQSILPYWYWNKTSVPVFYRRIKYRYEFGCVWIKAPTFYFLNRVAVMWSIFSKISFLHWKISCFYYYFCYSDNWFVPLHITWSFSYFFTLCRLSWSISFHQIWKKDISAYMNLNFGYCSSLDSMLLRMCLTCCV